MKNISYQTRCNLERAYDELLYYAEQCRVHLGRSTPTTEKAVLLAGGIQFATPITASELFTKAWRLCRDMEKMLKCGHGGL